MVVVVVVVVAVVELAAGVLLVEDQYRYVLITKQTSINKSIRRFLPVS